MNNTRFLLKYLLATFLIVQFSDLSHGQQISNPIKVEGNVSIEGYPISNITDPYSFTYWLCPEKQDIKSFYARPFLKFYLDTDRKFEIIHAGYSFRKPHDVKQSKPYNRVKITDPSGKSQRFRYWEFCGPGGGAKTHLEGDRFTVEFYRALFNLPKFLKRKEDPVPQITHLVVYGNHIAYYDLIESVENEDILLFEEAIKGLLADSVEIQSLRFDREYFFPYLIKNGNESMVKMIMKYDIPNGEHPAIPKVLEDQKVLTLLEQFQLANREAEEFKEYVKQFNKKKSKSISDYERAYTYCNEHDFFVLKSESGSFYNSIFRGLEPLLKKETSIRKERLESSPNNLERIDLIHQELKALGDDLGFAISTLEVAGLLSYMYEMKTEIIEAHQEEIIRKINATNSVEQLEAYEKYYFSATNNTSGIISIKSKIENLKSNSRMQ